MYVNHVYALLILVSMQLDQVQRVNPISCKVGSWFHYLCKNITIKRSANGGTWISDPRPRAPQLKQGDWTWIRSGYFLRWILNSSRNLEVTLVCFGASSSLERRLQQLAPLSILNSVVHDPYSLFVLILNDLSLQMDNTVWDVSEVFGDIELVNFKILVRIRRRI